MNDPKSVDAIRKFPEPVQISCFTKPSGVLTKTMSLDPKTRELDKDSSQCSMSKGRVKTISITSPNGFARMVRSREKNQAIAHGVCGFAEARIVTAREIDSSAPQCAGALPVIARTKEFFHYPEGPAVMMFDHDAAKPNAVAENDKALKVYRPDELLAVLATIHPEIASAGYVSTPSTSACIYDKDGNELRGEGSGSHIYLFVKNGKDIPRYLETLGRRLLLSNYGRYEISRSGSLLSRTLIDLSVGSPERLDFVSGADCEDGLIQRLPPPTVRDGDLLDTTTLPNLTDSEELVYQATIQRLKELAAPTQEIVRSEYINTEVTKLVMERGIEPHAARSIIESRQDHVLSDGDLLYFQHMKGKPVTVGAVLDNPKDFDKKSLADPLEPDYDGDSKTKALFYWNAGKPVINSFAHGQIKYRFERFKVVECTEADISDLLERAKTDCGAPHQDNILQKLAALKKNDKARFMQVRAELKKANASVLLTELDGDLRRVSSFPRMGTSLSPSCPSSSSFLGSYPSLSPSLKEKVLHFKEVLIVTEVDENGKEKSSLVIESKAAGLISQWLQGHFAFDVQGAQWLAYADNYWKTCPKTDFDTAVTAFIDSGAGWLGFRNNYQVGVASLLQKGGQNRLAEASGSKIPFQNGLFDVGLKSLEPITPENALTWILPFEYMADAECPTFLEWLSTAVDGDQGTVELLRAWINALLTGRPDLQIFLHLIGPAGTGKSTFGRLVFILIGNENATTTTLQQLETNRFETAGIYGKRLVAIEEADKYGGPVNTLKAMTGQDPLRLERKNQQQQGSFSYEGQTLMMSNERLATTDYTSGIERRRITVEFKRRITDEEKQVWRDRGGEETILHSEVPGIINWALALTREEVTAVFKKMPERIRLANLQAARFNNPVMDWLYEWTIPDATAQTKIGNKKKIKGDFNADIFEGYDRYLFPSYLTWCLASGRESVALQRFSNTLIDAARTLGVTLKKLTRSADGVKIQGIRLREGEEPPFDYEGLSTSVKDSVKDNPLIMNGMKDVKDFSTRPYREKRYMSLCDKNAPLEKIEHTDMPESVRFDLTDPAFDVKEDDDAIYI